MFIHNTNEAMCVSTLKPEELQPLGPKQNSKLHSAYLTTEFTKHRELASLDTSLRPAFPFWEFPNTQLAGLVWRSINGTLCNTCHMVGTVTFLVSCSSCAKDQVPRGGTGELNTGPHLYSIWRYPF